MSDTCAEKLVKARRQAIEEAKQALDAAHSQQGASQKEVVALLERKHSWSAMDLERYMSLIRSEHLNDQAIREAKEAVLAAENSLEEARAQLEKRERAQYHEEQIWSDTIRRNSTWVTFGLMGLNIFLLLASLVVFEPWRRKRMVREIKAALEEAQRPVIAPTPVPATTAIFTPAPTTVAVAATIPATAAIEAEIDKVVEPVGPLLDGLAAEAAPPDASVTREAVSSLPETLEAVPTETTTTSDTADLATESPATATLDPIEELATTDIEAELDHDRTRLEEITAKLEELVSDEQISVRKKDLTATVCASAAAGWVCAMIAFWIGTR
jgi:sensitive to high expression protein 9